MTGEQSNTFRFRGYQVTAIGDIFCRFGVEPSGPDDDPIVAYCRSHRAREGTAGNRKGANSQRVEADRVDPPF